MWARRQRREDQETMASAEKGNRAIRYQLLSALWDRSAGPGAGALVGTRFCGAWGFFGRSELRWLKPTGRHISRPRRPFSSLKKIPRDSHSQPVSRSTSTISTWL